MKGLRQTVANLFQGLGGFKVRREPEGIFSRSAHQRALVCAHVCVISLSAGSAGRPNTQNNARKPLFVCFSAIFRHTAARESHCVTTVCVRLRLCVPVLLRCE